MTTAEINAYLEWRAMREGKTVDVSPEAYYRDCVVEEILQILHQLGESDPGRDWEPPMNELVELRLELKDIEEQNA